MATINKAGNRMIQIQGGVIGPAEPRKKTLKVRTVDDYPSVAKAHLEVAEIYADRKMAGGIPICDESIALMQHMFTEEEASVMRYLKGGKRETAASIAAAEHRPVEEVRPLLDKLADDKRIIISFGKGDEKMYMSIPLLPGAFEFILSRTSMDSLTDWHRRFCELFETLYETGYVVEQPLSTAPPFIKYLPIGQIIEAHPMAYPSDKVAEILSRYSTIGVTLCQCRMTEEIVGRGCDRPKEVCMAMGPFAEASIRSGRLRRIELKEALEIKAEAEASGLVSWMDCQDPKIGGTSCSCCGCCCHLMRRVSEFNMPARLAPPHFVPKVDHAKCNYCGKCALACPMGAITVDVVNNTYAWDDKRCIGCAQCAVACSKLKAIDMMVVPHVDDFLQTNTRSFLS
ncbi:MAG: 4Fe-4S binding protein [Deltaproteobacteria bacterium]|nr:4Fe-4S binding protein [Deltaproteobacteria bacterium]